MLKYIIIIILFLNGCTTYKQNQLEKKIIKKQQSWLNIQYLAMKKPQLTNKKGTMTNKKCNECNNENENENLYWDNELDKPNMVDYTCLCQSCYNKLSIETNVSLNQALDFKINKWGF